MSEIKVFISTVTGSSEIKKKQQRILMVLDGKKINYDITDIAISCEDKDEMRKCASNPTALPPQICKGKEYLGDFDAFEEAIENEDLDTFLKL